MNARAGTTAAPRLTATAGAEDPAFRSFLDGDPATIRGAARLVASIVRFRGYFVPPHERADLEQDTLLHLWRAVTAPGFSFRNSFEGLVRAIAYRRCIDWRRLRRASSPLEVELVDGGERQDHRLLRDEAAELGRRLLQDWRGPCRELFQLHAVDGLSYREIATMKGRSEMALRTQMSACLREARARFGRLGGGADSIGRPRRTHDDP